MASVEEGVGPLLTLLPNPEEGVEGLGFRSTVKAVEETPPTKTAFNLLANQGQVQFNTIWVASSENLCDSTQMCVSSQCEFGHKRDCELVAVTLVVTQFASSCVVA